MVKAFAPLLVASSGTIVNMNSLAGWLNVPWMGRLRIPSRILVSYMGL